MDEFQGYGFVVCGKENTMGKLGFIWTYILLAIIVLEIKNIPDWLFNVINVILCITFCFVAKDSQ